MKAILGAAGLALLALLIAACSGGASDDELVTHAKTVMMCNARLTFRTLGPYLDAEKVYLANPRAAPVPTVPPPPEPHAIRLCYIASVGTETAKVPPQNRTIILAAGRACERLVNIDSDSAMADYLGCIKEGEEPLMSKNVAPTSSP